MDARSERPESSLIANLVPVVPPFIICWVKPLDKEPASVMYEEAVIPIPAPIVISLVI